MGTPRAGVRTRAPSVLEELRKQVNRQQRQIVTFAWKSWNPVGFLSTAAPLYYKFGETTVRGNLSVEGRRLIRLNDEDFYVPTLLGALVSTEGRRLESLLIRLIAFLRKRAVGLKFDREAKIEDSEIAAALRLKEIDVGRLWRVCSLTSPFPRAEGSMNKWYCRLPEDAYDIPSARSKLADYVRCAIVTYDPSAPVRLKDAARGVRRRRSEGSEAQEKSEGVIEIIESIINGLEDVLRSRSEESVQRYLKDNPILLQPSARRCLPKVKLGTEFVTDFVLELGEGEYVLIEIERAEHRLFTRKGTASKALVRAEGQVGDWRQWVQDHGEYARSSMPGITDPDCWVIIGRRHDLSAEDKGRLARRNKDRQHIVVMTYDDVLDSARVHAENLRGLGVPC